MLKAPIKINAPSVYIQTKRSFDERPADGFVTHPYSEWAERSSALSADPRLPPELLSPFWLCPCLWEVRAVPVPPGRMHRSVGVQLNEKDSGSPEYFFFLHLLLYILPKEGGWHLIPMYSVMWASASSRNWEQCFLSHVPWLHINQSTSNDANLLTLSAELMLLAASYEPLCLSSCLLISKHPLSEDTGHPAILVN